MRGGGSICEHMYSESGAGARTAGGTDFENPDEGQVDDAPQAAPPVMQEEDSPSGRPIGIGETMRRVFHKQIMAVHMDDASPTVLFVKIGVRKDLSVTYHRTNLARERLQLRSFQDRCEERFQCSVAAGGHRGTWEAGEVQVHAELHREDDERESVYPWC